MFLIRALRRAHYQLGKRADDGVDLCCQSRRRPALTDGAKPTRFDGAGTSFSPVVKICMASSLPRAEQA